MAVIIDRRKNDKGKSSTNRQKFIKRVRGLVREGIKRVVRDGNIKDLASDTGKKVKIPVRDLDEPHFHHDGSGINDRVLPGNKEYAVGDKIKRPDGGGGSGSGEGQASDQGEGEDTFTFHLSKDEFLDLFFENCALPDMIKENFALVNEEVTQRAGFSSDGSPAQLNVLRSMRGAKGRRAGLRAAKAKKIKLLEAEIQALVELIESGSLGLIDLDTARTRLTALQEQLADMKARLKAIPFLDPVDLRYNAWERVQIPTVQAVMFNVMDVSGSMDERKKELAKTFMILLYLFLERNYEHIDLVFVRYHTAAAIVDEQEFFYGKETGGTITSTGLQLAYDTMVEKYPTNLWNIYLAHASDGDNWHSDNALVEDLLLNKILPIVQYYAYVQIDPHGTQGLYGESLLDLFKKVSGEQRNLDCAVINSEEDVYPVFMKLFER